MTTLQKACTQKQFQANPAGCPQESVIGHAKAVVPNIPWVGGNLSSPGVLRLKRR
jgi:hypothetical protein